MTPGDETRVRSAIVAERQRCSDQVEALEQSVAAIIDASELTSTDDEHDPEGSTIAYERAQASALLQQARDDLVAIGDAAQRLDAGTITTCAACGGPISLERVLALPAVRTCIDCASSGAFVEPERHE